MKTIYKFELSDEIKMHVGAEILALQVQHGVPCLWALVDTLQSLRVRHFYQYGTGENIPDFEIGKSKYIGTWQEDGGTFIWHVFEALI